MIFGNYQSLELKSSGYQVIFERRRSHRVIVGNRRSNGIIYEGIDVRGSYSEIIDSHSKQLVQRFSPFNALEKLHGCGEAIQIFLSCFLSNADSCMDIDGNCPALKKRGAYQTHPRML